MRGKGIKPLVGIPVSIHRPPENRLNIHGSSENYIRAVADAAQAVPVLIPAMAEKTDFSSLIEHLDGLFLTGGRANVEPHHFGGPPFPDNEMRDPARDNTVLPLIRACIDAGVPVFGSCRGIQEINVALGGSLHYRVHQIPGMMDHRMAHDRKETIEERFRLRHALKLTPGSYLESLAGAAEVMVNSLHGQGIDRLADGLVIEGVSPDGLIEAVRLQGARAFTVGVQWHVEWRPAEHPLGKALFEEFGEAARQRARKRRGDELRLENESYQSGDADER